VQGTLQIVDRVLAANRTYHSLETQRDLSRQGERGYTLENDLLLFHDRLVVPEDGDLRVRLGTGRDPLATLYRILCAYQDAWSGQAAILLGYLES
jgi:hypothetical protein